MCDHHEPPDLSPEEAKRQARVEAEQARAMGLNRLADTILRDAGLDPEQGE